MWTNPVSAEATSAYTVTVGIHEAAAWSEPVWGRAMLHALQRKMSEKKSPENPWVFETVWQNHPSPLILIRFEFNTRKGMKPFLNQACF